jgi:glutathione S-transferase
MKLYYASGACSLAPHIILREAQLPFSVEKVDTKTHKTEHGVDYYTINPKGYVPLLELDSGERLTEGPIIAQYICDKAGRQDLMPAAGSMARYRVMEWQNYTTSELHKSFSPLFNPAFDDSAKAIFKAGLARNTSGFSAAERQTVFNRGQLYRGRCLYVYRHKLGERGRRRSLRLHRSAELLKRVAERPASVKR